MSTTGTAIQSRGTVVIDIETCKGCELCITACPPRVLEMSVAVNAIGFRYPQLHPGCTGCSACQLICPDFCFAIYKYETPITTQLSPSIPQGGTK